jgi:hypothetical protein
MNMKSRVAIICITAILTILATLTTLTNGLTDLVFAQGPPKITINLSDNDEVPPVQTEAAGVADLVGISKINNLYNL